MVEKDIYIRLGEFKEEVNKNFENVIKELKKIKRWNALDTIFDGADALADWLSFLKDLFDDVGTGVATLATGFTETAGVVTKKFPFSIPWDIAFLIGFLADSPQVPRYELPIQLERYGINERLVIDFEQFSAISKVSRMLLTIVYTVGLLKFTNKIISNKNGG